MNERPDTGRPPNEKSAPRGSLQSAGKRELTSSFAESRKALDGVISSARKIIRIFDKDLSDSGYRDPARVKLLEALVLSGRGASVRIVLHDVRNLDRDSARLMTLFRNHPSAFFIHRTVNAACNATDALVVADEHSFWHRLHHDQPQTVFVFGDNASTTPLLHRFEEIWESSEPAVAATVLGL